MYSVSCYKVKEGTDMREQGVHPPRPSFLVPTRGSHVLPTTFVASVELSSVHSDDVFPLRTLWVQDYAAVVTLCYPV